jgi:hypothetical protein
MSGNDALFKIYSLDYVYISVQGNWLNGALKIPIEEFLALQKLVRASGLFLEKDWSFILKDIGIIIERGWDTIFQMYHRCYDGYGIHGHTFLCPPFVQHVVMFDVKECAPKDVVFQTRGYRFNMTFQLDKASVTSPVFSVQGAQKTIEFIQRSS